MTGLRRRALAPNRRIRRDSAEGGYVAILVLTMVMACGLLVGFLVDGSAELQAMSRADTYASEAARSASIAVGPDASGGDVDTAAAVTAARSYLTDAGVTGTVTVTGPATVEVTVTVTGSTPIAGIAIRQTRSHTAELLAGITTGGTLR